jgi:hypothetical protein
VGSESDSDKPNSPYARRKCRVVEDERGRQIWQDTVKHVKLSLMNSGVFNMSEAQERLTNLGETGTDNDLDANMEVIDDNGGFDPYDSTKK